MTEISSTSEENEARVPAQKIVNRLSVINDPENNKDFWSEISNDELEESMVFLTEVLNQISLETSNRQNINVSVHIDHSPNDTL
ncbi:MAG: hypothetical protein NE328_09890 [Lentisphaeraceae bacterium]|nr:hypothetical protein [Lentisphaeraceae bacterium]